MQDVQITEMAIEKKNLSKIFFFFFFSLYLTDFKGKEENRTRIPLTSRDDDDYTCEDDLARSPLRSQLISHTAHSCMVKGGEEEN